MAGGRVWRTLSGQQVAGERPAKEERTQRKRMRTNVEENRGQQFRELPVKRGFAETGQPQTPSSLETQCVATS